MTDEPDLSKTFGADIEIFDGVTISNLVRCYDKEINRHIQAYSLAHCSHNHFMERVTYFQLRKRNLLEIWSSATESQRESEPF